MAGQAGRKCPSCGAPVDLYARKCPKCRKALPKPDALDEILAGIIDHGAKAGLIKGEEEGLEDLELGELPPPKPMVTPPPAAQGKQPEEGKSEETVRFECPSCGASVDESATECPQCGVVFSNSEQFDCPVCGSAVPFESVQCPKCGVRFVEEEAPALLGADQTSPPASPTPKPPSKALEVLDLGSPTSRASPREAQPSAGQQRRPNAPAPAPSTRPGGYTQMAAPSGPVSPPAIPGQQELSAQVSEVKKLLVLGKRVGLNLGNVANTITEATAQAKRRDVPGAIRLMVQARESLALTLTRELQSRIGSLPAQIRRAGNQLLASGDLEAVVNLLDRSQAGGEPPNQAVRTEVEKARQVVLEARGMGMDVAEAEQTVARAARALEAGDAEAASGLARQAYDRALGTIRDNLAEEMKRSRNLVFELKMKGEKVDQAIEQLKQASNCLRDNDHQGAYRYLQAFRAEIPANLR